MATPAIRVDAVSKKFCRTTRRAMWYGAADVARSAVGLLASPALRKGEFWVLDGVSLEVHRGETLGILGANGSGKSTLLKLISGIFLPDQGSVSVRGRVGALIQVGAGFHPLLTGRENIFVNGAILGMSKREIERKLDSIIAFAELETAIDSPVKFYSSGMHVRLGFSIAAHMEPDILLLDEVLAVGDTRFRAKCFQRLGEILPRTAVVFVSHDMNQVSRICDRVVVLEHGKVTFAGPTEEGIERYLRASTPVAVPARFLHPSVREVSCAVARDTLAYGDTLGVEVTLQTSTALPTGLCLLTVTGMEQNCAQASFSHLLPTLPAGTTTLSFDVGPLCLRRDRYTLTLTITGDSRKDTLAHCLNVASFQVRGERGFGVPYLVPLTPRRGGQRPSG